MHQPLFFVAATWIALLLAAAIVLLARARTAMDTVLALDTLTLILVAGLGLLAQTTGSASYLDAGLLLALLSFVGTVAAARYFSEGKLFS